MISRTTHKLRGIAIKDCPTDELQVARYATYQRWCSVNRLANHHPTKYSGQATDLHARIKALDTEIATRADA